MFDDQTLPVRLGKIQMYIDPKFTATVADLAPVFAKLSMPFTIIFPNTGAEQRIHRPIPGWLLARLNGVQDVATH